MAKPEPQHAAYPGISWPGLTFPSQPLTNTNPDGYVWTEATHDSWVLSADLSQFLDYRRRGDIHQPFSRPSAW
jgi:hypothetical protein